MDDDDDDRAPIAWGDLSAITLLAGVGIFTLWLIGDMLFGGHPLAMLFGSGPPQAQVAPTPEEIRNTPMHLDPGEVRIFLPTKPKTPSVKPKTQGTAETPH